MRKEYGVQVVNNIKQWLLEVYLYPTDNGEDTNIKYKEEIENHLDNLADYIKEREFKYDVAFEVPNGLEKLYFENYKRYVSFINCSDISLEVEGIIYRHTDFIFEIILSGQNMLEINEMYTKFISEKDILQNSCILEDIIKKYYIPEIPEHKWLVQECINTYLQYKYSPIPKSHWVIVSLGDKEPLSYNELLFGNYLVDEDLDIIIKELKTLDWCINSPMTKTLIHAIFQKVFLIDNIEYCLDDDGYEEETDRQLTIRPEGTIESILTVLNSSKEDGPYDYKYMYDLLKRIRSINIRAVSQ